MLAFLGSLCVMSENTGLRLHCYFCQPIISLVRFSTNHVAYSFLDQSHCLFVSQPIILFFSINQSHSLFVPWPIISLVCFLTNHIACLFLDQSPCLFALSTNHVACHICLQSFCIILDLMPFYLNSISYMSYSVK